MQAKATNNVRDKSHPQQRKMSSKAIMGKKPVKESEANSKLSIVLMQANVKSVMRKLMLTVNTFKQAGKSCIELHNYYINNYKKGQDIIASLRKSTF
jgi:hypothetical protein